MESPQRSGNENSEMSDDEEEGAGKAGVNGGNQDKTSKHHGSSKNKKKKHKHRSKHKKHKHMSEEEKHKRKHKHKHKKHRRKEGMPPSSGAIDRKADVSPSYENPNVDDRALLEDLEKQRALIKAELDSQLMDGKVQSGMGLILQGYISGSEEDGEGQRPQNGEQCQKGSVGKMRSPRDRSSRDGKAIQDSPDSKASSKLHSRSREGNRVARESRGGRLSNSGKERAKECSRSKDRRCSQSQNRSRERVKKSQSPYSKRRSAELKTEQKGCSSEGKGAQTERHCSPCAEERRTAQEQGSRRSGSPAHSHNQRSHSKNGCSELDRNKRPGKSPSKDASSGKENRSPCRRHASNPLCHRSSSTHQRERQSHQTASSASKQSYSPSRNRSPARRGRSRSADRRRDSPSR